MRVGVEVGGTFTDLILIGDGGEVVATGKALSTPDDPSIAVIEAIQTLAQQLDSTPLVHGSTVATNAVIERKGARTGFLVTSGFADLLELQRQDREWIYELQYRKPTPLVPRELTREIPERLTASGEVIQPLDEDAALRAIDELAVLDVDAIAVCLLHSYANPAHEQQIRKLAMMKHPEIHVSLSSEVVAEFREYERASTTTIDAFVKPVIDRYLGHLEASAGREGVSSIWMMQSNGGLLPAGYIREHPARTLFSGPAAGVTGAIRCAEAAGIANIITMDMGGTSTDVCLVTGGRPEITTEATIDRLPIKVPMLDIVSVGAGGGSIVTLDPGGMLQVGPQSAGADPGPACYGMGGNLPATTDANVVRGLIRPGHFLGGDIQLNPDAAWRVISRIAGEVGSEPGPFAEDVYRVANATMANAIRLVSTERGYDPRDYTLVAYGGAGPLHAAAVAGELSIGRVLVPPYPGLLSAYGLLAGDFQRDFARTAVRALDELTPSTILAAFDALAAEARDEVASYGTNPDACEFIFGLDMRYRGQGYELTVPLESSELEQSDEAGWLTDRFHTLHRTRYGHATPGEPVEAVTYRVSVVQRNQKPATPRVEAGDEREPEQVTIIVEGRETPCNFLWRASLAPGFTTAGPAVIEEPTATTFAPPGWSLTVDEQTNLLLQRKADRKADR